MKRAAAGLGVWALVCAGAWLFNGSPRPALVALLVVVVGLVVVMLLDLTATTGYGESGWQVVAPEPVHPPGSDQRLLLLDRLVRDHLVSREPGDSLARHLVDLADQRLVARHGISLRADSDRAAELMPEVVALSRAGSRRLSAADVGALLDRIEAL
jgi:hypothetical protein